MMRRQRKIAAVGLVMLWGCQDTTPALSFDSPSPELAEDESTGGLAGSSTGGEAPMGEEGVVGDETGAPTTDSPLSLLPAASTDEVLENVCDRSIVLESISLDPTPVTVSWPVLSSERGVEASASAYMAKSRGYRFQVSGTELEQGVVLPLSAPQPVIRLTSSVAEIDPSVIRVREAGESGWRSKAAIETAVDATQLKSLLAFETGRTSMIRLSKAIAPGLVELSAPASGDRGVMIQVNEPQSDAVLQLQTTRATYHPNDTLTFSTGWSRPDITSEHVDAVLISPSGERFEVPMSENVAAPWTGTVALEQPIATPGQLWHVVVDVEGVDGTGESILRTAKTAFSYVERTARLTGDLSRTETDEEHFQLAFAVDVAIAGRYALSGVLYGTDTSGAVRPMLMGQSAMVLEPGSGSLALTFDRTLMPEDVDVSVPLELRDLRLVDQSRMGVLHRQAQAVVLE